MTPLAWTFGDLVTVVAYCAAIAAGLLALLWAAATLFLRDLNAADRETTADDAHREGRDQ